MYRALKAGADPLKIVFAGVGKSELEIREALEVGIKAFNVESHEELKVINKIAEEMEQVATVSLRVNTYVDPNTHEYITTGK